MEALVAHHLERLLAFVCISGIPTFLSPVLQFFHSTYSLACPKRTLALLEWPYGSQIFT